MTDRRTGWTDRRTEWHTTTAYRASVASHGKYHMLKLHEISVHVNCGRGSALFWRKYELCSSDFVDDVMFSLNLSAAFGLRGRAVPQQVVINFQRIRQAAPRCLTLSDCRRIGGLQRHQAVGGFSRRTRFVVMINRTHSPKCSYCVKWRPLAWIDETLSTNAAPCVEGTIYEYDSA